MNNKMGKIIIILIILILIVSIILIMILKNLKQNIYREEIDTNSENGSSYISEYTKEVNNSISEEAYFDILTCANKYLNIIYTIDSKYYIANENGENDKQKAEEYFRKSVYNVLSSQYIKNNGITVENIKNKIKLLNKNTTFVPLEAKLLKNGDVSSFLVHGLAESISDFKVIDEIFFIINIDAAYELFSIEPIYGTYKSINEINVTSSENTIEENENNAFTRKGISYENNAKEYMNIYKRLILGSPEIMYNKLNSEYKEKRFKSLDNFKKYVEENKQDIMETIIQEYLVNTNIGYTQYVLKDQYGKIYIFNEKSILNYEIMLDSYTIEQAKFTKEYNGANNQKKVMMNIDKFFQMINNKDYAAAYNCLADSFKQNYFKTEESFKNYIKNNLYKYSNITYVNFNDKISGVYGYDLILTNKQDTSKSKEFNIVMKLNSGTDFEMSFEI